MSRDHRRPSSTWVRPSTLVPAFLVLVLLVGTLLPAHAEDEADKEAIFAALGDLVGGTWVADGAWNSGDPFRQRRVHEWDLDGTILRQSSFIPDEDGDGWIPRNFGVRAWDEEEGQMRFWEFDRFGAITPGTMGLADGVLFYQYEYSPGEQTLILRDTWERVDEDTYAVTIGTWEDGSWGRIFLQTEFRRQQ